MDPIGLTHRLLEEITDNFSEERKIGQGAYGKVYRGEDTNGEEIAVKMLHYVGPGLDDKQFQNEFDSLRKLNHQNIVKLIGYCYETQHRLIEYNGKIIFAEETYRALCLEYLHNGSLQKHLSDECDGLDWHTRYKIIRGTCEGLKYLHEGFEKPIYHLDLKPDNILLDKNMVPKLADFGLSALFNNEHTRITQSPIGTVGYLPPEYIERGLVSKKLDIFSLGVVMIKIISGPNGRSKTAEMPRQEVIDLVHANWRNRLQAKWSGSSLEAYSQQVMGCTVIALRCMEIDRHNRPNIADIIQELTEMETATDEVSAGVDPMVRPSDGVCEILSVEPLQLQFPLGLEPNKSMIACPLHLTNRTDRHVIYRLLITKEYFIGPLYGVVPPRCRSDARAILGAVRGAGALHRVHPGAGAVRDRTRLRPLLLRRTPNSARMAARRAGTRWFVVDNRSDEDEPETEAEGMPEGTDLVAVQQPETGTEGTSSTQAAGTGQGARARKKRGTNKLHRAPTDRNEKIVFKYFGDCNLVAIQNNVKEPGPALGTILRMNYPGMVDIGDVHRAALSWDDYKAVQDGDGSVADRCLGEFWARYALPSDFEERQRLVAHEVIDRKARHIVNEMISLSRVKAVEEYYRRRGQNLRRDGGARDIYLIPDEYNSCRPSWCDKCPDAWRWMCDMYGTKEWRQRLTRNKSNRNASVDSCVTHLGSHSMAQRKKFMEAQTGGGKSTGLMCTQTHIQGGTQMNEYVDAMTTVHGPECVPTAQPLDPVVIHSQMGGRRHGRLAFGNAYLCSSEYMPEVRAARRSTASSTSSRRVMEENRALREQVAELHKRQEEGEKEREAILRRLESMERNMHQTHIPPQGFPGFFDPSQSPMIHFQGAFGSVGPTPDGASGSGAPAQPPPLQFPFPYMFQFPPQNASESGAPAQPAPLQFPYPFPLPYPHSVPDRASGSGFPAQPAQEASRSAGAAQHVGSGAEPTTSASADFVDEMLRMPPVFPPPS